MRYTIRKTTYVAGTEREKVVYIEKGWWIFKWNEVVRKDSIDRDIHIMTEHKIDHVYLNGTLLTP